MKKLLLVIFSVFSFFIGKTQVVFVGSTSAFAAGAISLTFSKTIPAGNNRFLMVGVGVEGQGTAISGVTWNGRALTQFTASNVSAASSRGAIYYLALGSSASPTTANVVVTLGTNKDLSAGAADYTGVWQSAPIVNPTISNGNDRFPNITFSSDFGHKAVCLMSSVAGSVTGTGSGQTPLWSIGGAFPSASSHETGAPTVAMSYTIASSNKWIMIGGTIQDNAVMLPVELSKFEAVCNYTNYAVSWETASEKESDYFELSRRTDNNDWTSVAKKKAKGNSSTTVKYALVDTFESYSPVYYRLTQYDKDGTFTNSNIIHASCENQLADEIYMFPIPPTNTLNFNFELRNLFNPYEIRIYSSRGKICYHGSIESEQKKFTKSINFDLESGLYFVVITDAFGHIVLNQKFPVN